MLGIKGKKIVNQKDEVVCLTGIALGGWLMMEGYMLGGANIAESVFKKELGSLEKEFTREFRSRFITKKDANIIKSLGFNCVRIPFNYRIIEEEGVGYLKKVAEWFYGQKVYVILDMHAVPGAQNCDWHSDSSGRAGFFENESDRKYFLKLWKDISTAFKDDEYLAGYDVMNEPVTDKIDILKQAYRDVNKTIRDNNDNHIIFYEGNRWAQEVDFIPELLEENNAISIHFYEPTKYTFNQIADLKYPGRIDGVQWNKSRISRYLKKYSAFNIPIYVGEFGVASRCPHCSYELNWLRDALNNFKRYGYHFTYWTYKSAGGMKYPDGLFQLFDSSDVLSIGGEHSGMESIIRKMKEDPQRVYDVFDTSNFQINKKLMNLLKKYL